jgi:6-phosphogluconolactonase (cycloisomerase 2 family)
MGGTAAGITRLESRANGSLEVVDGFLISAPSPAFLASADGELYAALEGEGAVLLVDGGRFSSGGQWPCHIGVYEGCVVVANYFDGRLGLRSGQVVEPEPGRGPLAAQEGPHAHATAQIAPGVIVSADLGTDRLGVHALEGGVLTRLSSVPLRPGTGPRDLLVNGNLLYVLGEHGRTVTVAEWTGGSLEILDEVPLPGAVEGDQASALALGGGYLYAGLRGSNQVAVLAVSADGTEIDGVTSVSSAGDWPRHLALDGRVLHVVNQRSNGVASFAIDAGGIPQLISEPTFVASPSYLLRD